MTQAGNVHRNIPDRRGANLYLDDPQLAALLGLYLAPPVLEHVTPQLERLGALAGDELERLALDADRNPPALQPRDRRGARLERVRKHPSYVALERYAFAEFGLAAMSHRPGVFGAAHELPPAVKYALVYLLVQAEFGLCCPLSMTDSLTRTLLRFAEPGLVRRYFERLTTQDFDSLLQGAMFMTEQAAGSDVGAIETVARREHGQWRLYGDKWFCSNPDADLAMVLARAEGAAPGTRGLSLFLLPRVLDDGQLNAYRILRLKDKLGTRSMASGEIVLEGALAYLVGDAGAGFKQMTDMINMSRLANGVRAAGLMRRGVGEALFIARNRSAFGRRLVELPLMRRQLAKMTTTAEQARSFVLHTAQVLERADAGDAEAARVLRILTPLAKFRICRDARKVAGDAMEARGGCGYIEEWSDARVLRDAHLGSIWEGTSNIVALDVARATRREGALGALDRHLRALIARAGDDAGSAALADAWARAAGRMQTVADDPRREAQVRAASTALYDAASAVILAWEGAELSRRGQPAGEWRSLLAGQVLRHKLTARDPLADEDDDTHCLERLIDGISASGRATGTQRAAAPAQA